MEGRSCGGGISTGPGVKILVTVDDIDIQQKWCPQCRQYYPITGFNKNKREYCGRQDICRACSKVRNDYHNKRLAAKNTFLDGNDKRIVERHGKENN